MAEPLVVVTVVSGRHDHLARQRDGLRRLREGGQPHRHVVVAMGDPEVAAVAGPDTEVLDVAPPDEGLPLAQARNTGVAHALAGGAGLVVLLDVDCLPGEGLLPRYRAAASQRPDALLAGPVTYLRQGRPVPDRPADLAALTDPHPARPVPPDDRLEGGGDHRLFWSLSAAVTPATWERIGGFCTDYVGYGGEDTDLGLTAAARGVELVWVGGAHAYHQHHPVSRPPVEHVADIVRNARVFRRRWGRWPMEGWLRELADLGLLVWEPQGDRLELTAG